MLLAPGNVALCTPASAGDLEFTGSCSGPVRIRIDDVATGARYALLSAPTKGPRPCLLGPCSGTPLELRSFDLRLHRVDLD